MNVTYTGKLETFYPTQEKKLEVRFSKLAKLLDGKGEKNSRVVLNKKRNLHGAEITVNYMDHSLVGEAQDADQYLAITSALDKLEKQVLKVRAKRRDVKAGPQDAWDRKGLAKAAPVLTPEPEPRPNRKVAAANGKRRVFRVDHSANVKPITLEEAVLELSKPGDYVVYRDAHKDCLSVLLMRPDGHLDLIEG